MYYIREDRGGWWEAFYRACLDVDGKILTDFEKLREMNGALITNIRGEWRFDEEGVFWMRVKGGNWKATDVEPIVRNRLGEERIIYFAGSDIETSYFNWSGPDAGEIP
ncbi:MAG: hypothetical protein N2314_05495 [Brevinematales bacterium]|nr:hypothetical protein [Brevinematales bacterium]